VEHLLHQPVMPEQVARYLQPRPGGSYVDLTLGLGGHAEVILERSSPDGRLLGIDRDEQALEHAGRRLSVFGNRFQALHGSFSELPDLMARVGWTRVDGLLADLGVSSLQLDSGQRGFSLMKSGPLDMRMDNTKGATLAEKLADLDVRDLADALARLGEVSHARKIAGKILASLRAGRLINTLDLARVSSEGPRRGKIHPATRVFMALRMLVNREIEELESLLEKLPDPLREGGRVVFIAFHSIEDRLIKKRFAELAGQCSCPPGLPECRCGARRRITLLTRRVAKPNDDEIAQNPRSRSARLRAAERLAA
jgi:16S rRNA (cytosine1402-N4)-methyltransferase